LKSPKQPLDTPEVRKLFAIISELHSFATGFNGIIVRSVGLKYATETSFFSGSGAAKTGGRWTNLSKASKRRIIAVEDLK